MYSCKIDNSNLEDALKEYIALLKNRDFFDAHEVLEEAWHPLRKANHPLKNLVKGLINASIAFEHIKRDREDSYRKATTVFNSYRRHKPLYREGIEHEELFSHAIKKGEKLTQLYLVDSL
jgi:hypothetical protein